ncbi:unnamed protein product [Durusdinium trenchii]|uniref:Uncharacterized protein n=1 Tax=Durusdinium trenchii TaxID=1381693 RepID=A0ABP0N1Y2_9DINO
MVTGRDNIGMVVKRLACMGAPKAFIMLVILTAFSANLPRFPELTFLEFFAGEGNVWKAVRADSKNAVGIDWNYFDNPDGQNPMDILSNAGLGLYIHLILSCRESAFATVWGTVCSSWVRINAFTSCRSLLNPEGDCSKRYISLANAMVSRILCCAQKVLRSEPPYS